MLTARPYQIESVQALFEVWMQNQRDKVPSERPLVVAPTGAGKSYIIAMIVKRVLAKKPDARILILSHNKEIVDQDATEVSKILDKPIGIYSAGLGIKRFLNVTCANIQSIYKKKDLAESLDLILIDECHRLGRENDSMYRKFLDSASKARICGLTATPMRMDQGSLIGRDKFFNCLAYDISISELVEQKFLCPLISKAPDEVDMSGVRKSGSDFSISESEERFCPKILSHCQSIISSASDRKHWLIFATSIKHAKDVSETLQALGIKADYISGEMLNYERDLKVAAFKRGEIQALVNCDILTTGFNFPALDLIVLLRATKSTSLYMQICGRGMRTIEGKENCLVLDYGGNIKRHGAIDDIKIKQNKETKEMEIALAPIKTCPECSCICGTRTLICRVCGYLFPMSAKLEAAPSQSPIMKMQALNVSKEQVFLILSQEYSLKPASDKPAMVTYKGFGVDVSNSQVKEYIMQFFCFDHQGYAASKAREAWKIFGGLSPAPKSTSEAMERISELKKVEKLKAKKDGKFWRITKIKFAPELTHDEYMEKVANEYPF
jgi:DNA repair protein RadD